MGDSGRVAIQSRAALYSRRFFWVQRARTVSGGGSSSVRVALSARATSPRRMREVNRTGVPPFLLRAGAGRHRGGCRCWRERRSGGRAPSDCWFARAGSRRGSRVQERPWGLLGGAPALGGEGGDGVVGEGGEGGETGEVLTGGATLLEGGEDVGQEGFEALPAGELFVAGEEAGGGAVTIVRGDVDLLGGAGGLGAGEDGVVDGCEEGSRYEGCSWRRWSSSSLTAYSAARGSKGIERRAFTTAAARVGRTDMGTP